ncbi:MAG: flagellar hook-basal body complex protein FliE [Nitrospinae bacterium]|nr:flagellar hook-basal body complex protein FliE [Nitrospinota bacterium]
MEDITIKNNINAVVGPGLDKLKDAGEAQKTADGKTFADTLSESLAKVNSLQKEADKAIEDLVSGNSQNIHETMIAVNKADLAFRMTMQVRNKIVEAYQEVMRLQI